MSNETKPTAPLDLVIAGASILKERRDTHVEPTGKAFALGELLVSVFTGIPPNEKDIAVLRESKTHTPEPWTKALTEQVQPRTKQSPKTGLQAKRQGWVRERQQQCATMHREIPLMENFALPSDPAAQEAYVDALISRGVPEHEVWLQTRRHYAVSGG